MNQVERIGISLEKDLLSSFDKLISKQGYANRSEAVRDLIRDQLGKDQISNPKAKAVAAVCIVFDHHFTKLMQKMTQLQHSHLLKVICSTHVHLEANDCMEIIVLKGQISDIKKVAEKILSQKGVKFGRINIAPIEKSL